MVNEEIFTALKNAIEHGDSLQEAMQILVNSGYNPTEVQEASNFISGGSLYLQQPKPEEHLTMPSEKSSIQRSQVQQPRINQPQQFQPKQQLIQQSMQRPIQKPMQNTQIQQNPLIQPNQAMQQNQSQIMQNQGQPAGQFPVDKMQQPYSQPYSQPDSIAAPQPIPQSPPIAKQLEKIKPRKSYLKEIFLLIVLLILIGVLTTVIIFKDKILAWFV